MKKKRLSREEAPGALVRQFGGSVAIIFAMTGADSRHGVTIRKVTETGLATSTDVAEVLCNHLGCSHKKRFPEEYYERQRKYAESGTWPW